MSALHGCVGDRGSKIIGLNYKRSVAERRLESGEQALRPRRMGARNQYRIEHTESENGAYKHSTCKKSIGALIIIKPCSNPDAPLADVSVAWVRRHAGRKIMLAFDEVIWYNNTVNLLIICLDCTNLKMGICHCQYGRS